MEVVRVEDRWTGTGWYQTRTPDRLDRLRFRHSLNNHFENDPHPDEDDMDGWENKHFGFATVDQAFDWFGDEFLAALDGEDFALVLYDVPEWAVVFGRKQLAFDKSQAERIGSLTT